MHGLEAFRMPTVTGTSRAICAKVLTSTRSCRMNLSGLSKCEQPVIYCLGILTLTLEKAFTIETEVSMTGKRVLVVDDDLPRLRFMEKCLESGGYSVKTAENGREALSRLDQAAYDTVLLDYRMPDGLAEALFLQFSTLSGFDQQLSYQRPSLECPSSHWTERFDPAVCGPASPIEVRTVRSESVTKQDG
jgi:hypothetical protein